MVKLLNRILNILVFLSVVFFLKKQYNQIQLGRSTKTFEIPKDVKEPDHLKRVIFSPEYIVDDFYKSMSGPASIQKIIVEQTKSPEVLWIKSVKAEVVTSENHTPLSNEYMCHLNVDVNMNAYQRIFGWRKSGINRLFSLSQGQLEVPLPEGFGVPILSWQPLIIESQLLNLSSPERGTKLKHKITIEYVKEQDLTFNMVPLFLKASQVMVGIGNKYCGEWGVSKKSAEKSNLRSCSLGEPIRVNGKISNNIRDAYGARFSGHWVVPKGDHTYSSLVTKILDIPFDSTIHSVAAHLHPYAQFIKIYDITDERIVFQSNVEQYEGKIGLKRVEGYCSPEGLKLYKDHDYRLTTYYKNETDVQQDAMASLFLYVADYDFKKPRDTNSLLKLLQGRHFTKYNWTKGQHPPTTLVKRIAPYSQVSM